MAHLSSAEEALKELAGLAADRSLDGLHRIMAAARRRLDMDVCLVGHFTGDREVIRAIEGKEAGTGLEPGAAWPAAESLGKRILDGRIPNLVPDVVADPQLSDLDEVRALGVAAYAAVPVTLSSGLTYGVLECISHQPAPWLVERDAAFLQVLGRLAGDEVERLDLVAEKEQVEMERIRSVLAEGSLSMVFQPIVDLQEGTIVGMEALARFGTEPDRSPDTWFAQAGLAGLRTDLELLAIAAALAQLEAIPPSAYLSVNASPETVMSPRFLSMLDGPLGGRVVVEITEHATIEDYTSLKRALDELRLRGARVAVDDTGAGFTTLAHIHRLLPDIIKIDNSLTHDIDRDPVRRSLVSSLMAFADEAGATVSAEGIETRAEGETLRALGVPCGQGWFLGEPGPLVDVTRSVGLAPHLIWADQGTPSIIPR
jgi:EAL domain-containing protein (putative c-di-GMP-specific phosphodiesterase class I)